MKNEKSWNHEHEAVEPGPIETRPLRRDLLVVTGLLVLGLLVLTFSALPILNRWMRARLIDRLTQGVSQVSDDQVEFPIRQLASLGSPAIQNLVAITASPRTVPATYARKEVDQRLAAWLIQAGIDRSRSSPMWETADHHSTFLSSRLVLLAEALARYVESMDAAGQRWAEQVAMQILLYVDRIAPAPSLQVLADCQAVLAAVPREKPESSAPDQLLQAVSTDQRLPPLTRPTLEWSSLATTPRTNQKQRIPHAQHDLSSGDDTTLGHGLIAGPQGQDQDELFQDGNPVRQVTEPSERANQSADTGNPLRKHSLVVIHRLPPPLKSESNGALSADAPAGVTGPSHGLVEQVFDVPTPTEMAARQQQLHAMPLRELMVRLGSSHDFEAALIRAVARARGILDAELTLAPKLGSTRSTDRLELLQQLSQLPAREARRWLRWLLEDDEGDVRLQALTMMATTNDPRIESLARQRLLQDTDPRVVALATRIIEIRR